MPGGSPGKWESKFELTEAGPGDFSLHNTPPSEFLLAFCQGSRAFPTGWAERGSQCGVVTGGFIEVRRKFFVVRGSGLAVVLTRQLG